MVFQLILAGILLLLVVVYFAVVYWQITLAVIGVIVFLWWWHSRRKSVKEEQYNSDERYEYVEPEDPIYEKCFEILHLNKDATIQEVKEQYRRFALMYHPDKNGRRKKEAEQKFIAVTSAYEVIMNQKETGFINSS